MGPSHVVSRVAEEKFKEHARWIGIVVANGSILDSELEGVYRAVLKLDYERSKIAYYAIQNWHARRNVISAAIKNFHAGTPIEKAWDDLFDSLRTAYRLRNRAAHAIWGEEPGTGELLLNQTHVSGEYTKERTPYPLHNLKQNASYIADVAAKLNALQVLIVKGQVRP